MGGYSFPLSQAPGLSPVEFLGSGVSLKVTLDVASVTESAENLRALTCSAFTVVRAPPPHHDHVLSCYLCEITYFKLEN